MLKKITVIAKSKQRGSSLAIAVFIIIVMSLLTTAITDTISSSQDLVVQEVLGTRALMAAESANDLSLGQIFPLDSVAQSCTLVTTSRDFSTIDGLQNCVAATTCTEQAINSQTYYLISSTGVCKGSLADDSSDYSCDIADEVCVSRTVELEAREL